MENQNQQSWLQNYRENRSQGWTVIEEKIKEVSNAIDQKQKKLRKSNTTFVYYQLFQLKKYLDILEDNFDSFLNRLREGEADSAKKLQLQQDVIAERPAIDTILSEIANILEPLRSAEEGNVSEDVSLSTAFRSGDTLTKILEIINKQLIFAEEDLEVNSSGLQETIAAVQYHLFCLQKNSRPTIERELNQLQLLLRRIHLQAYKRRFFGIISSRLWPRSIQEILLPELEGIERAIQDVETGTESSLHLIRKTEVAVSRNLHRQESILGIGWLINRSHDIPRFIKGVLHRHDDNQSNTRAKVILGLSSTFIAFLVILVATNLLITAGAVLIGLITPTQIKNEIKEENRSQTETANRVQKVLADYSAELQQKMNESILMNEAFIEFIWDDISPGVSQLNIQSCEVLFRNPLTSNNVSSCASAINAQENASDVETENVEIESAVEEIVEAGNVQGGNAQIDNVQPASATEGSAELETGLRKKIAVLQTSIIRRESLRSELDRLRENSVQTNIATTQEIANLLAITQTTAAESISAGSIQAVFEKIEQLELDSQAQGDDFSSLNSSSLINVIEATLQDQRTLQAVREDGVLLATVLRLLDDADSEMLSNSQKEKIIQSLITGVPAQLEQHSWLDDFWIRSTRNLFSWSQNEPLIEHIQRILLALFAGALGSIISILLRLNALKRDDIELTSPFFLGLFQPLIGATFGVIALAILSTEVVEVIKIIPEEISIQESSWSQGEESSNSDDGSASQRISGPLGKLDTQEFYTILFVGFFVGFSERLAKNALGTLDQGLPKQLS